MHKTCFHTVSVEKRVFVIIHYKMTKDDMDNICGGDTNNIYKQPESLSMLAAKCDWSFVENANLISKDDLEKVFSDKKLLNECGDIYPLKYLIACEPNRGLYYAAKHGIFTLYKASKRYLKRNISFQKNQNN
jgi:hypothetical protein